MKLLYKISFICLSASAAAWLLLTCFFLFHEGWHWISISYEEITIDRWVYSIGGIGLLLWFVSVVLYHHKRMTR